MADRLGLPRALSSVSVKQRARGASDAETLWSLIASLAAGNGALLHSEKHHRSPGRPIPPEGSGKILRDCQIFCVSELGGFYI